MVQLLVQLGSNVDRAEGDSVCDAAINGRLEILRVLIQGGADVGCCRGSVALHAKRRGHKEVGTLEG